MQKHKTDTDLKLAVLDIIRPSGMKMQLWQIAEISGLSRQRILQLESRAIEKLSKRVNRDEFLQWYSFVRNRELPAVPTPHHRHD